MKSKATQVHCQQKKKKEKRKTADGGNQTSNNDENCSCRLPLGHARYDL